MEALALGEEPPEIKKEDDFTIPEPFSDSAKKAILAFRVSLLLLQTLSCPSPVHRKLSSFVLTLPLARELDSL